MLGVVVRLSGEGILPTDDDGLLQFHPAFADPGPLPLYRLPQSHQEYPGTVGTKGPEDKWTGKFFCPLVH